MAYPDDLRKGDVVSVELSPPMVSDTPDTAAKKLDLLEQRLARFTEKELYVNITDGLLGQKSMELLGLIQALRNFHHDRNYVILNLSCNHQPDEARKIVYAVLSAGYSHFLLVPGDLLNGSRPIPRTVDLEALVTEAAAGTQPSLGASLNPHNNQPPKLTLPRLYGEFGISFLQTQQVSVGEMVKIENVQRFLTEFGVNAPVAYGVLRGDKEGKILLYAEKLNMPIPVDVRDAYRTGISQEEAVVRSMVGLHNKGITNFMLTNAAPIAGRLIQDYRMRIGKL